MKVRIKRLHEKAVIPSYARIGDAGLDLIATTVNRVDQEQYMEYGTGISLEVPEGYVALLFPRSSISTKDLLLCNSVGVIDSGYRGEVKVRFKPMGSTWENKNYLVGDKIAQLIIIPFPQIEFEEVKNLASSERGSGGFGSSGS
jgi:dUTP pyrophosphatase